jgi:hypothetical protein
MPGQTDPLSYEEHRQLSDELRGISSRLRALYALAEDVYGADSAAAARFGDALGSLARVRGEMQTQAAADLPEYQTRDLYD